MITELLQTFDIVTALNDIETFNHLGGHLSKPNNPGLNYDLMLEELNEYKEASEEGNRIKKADALADQFVVLWGNILKEGLADEFFGKILRSVNESNLSKFCRSEKEANDSVAAYSERGIKTHHTQPITGFWAIINSDTGKILKGINYREPQIAL